MTSPATDIRYRYGNDFADLPLAVSQGGTGASTPSGARDSLELGTAAVEDVGTSGSVVAKLDGSNTWTATQTINAPFVGGLVINGNTIGVTLTSESDTAAGRAFLTYRRTRSASAALQNGDWLGTFDFAGWNGLAYFTSVLVQAITVEAFVAGVAGGSDLDFQTTGPGTVTRNSKFRVKGSGDLTAANNTVTFLDSAGNHRMKAHTLAVTVALTATAGLELWCSDLGGGPGLLVGDGTGWKRASLSGQQDLNNTTNFAVTPLDNANYIRLTGTIAADRTITLNTTPSTKVRPGSFFHVTRTGAGAFNWSVGGLKNLAVNQWAIVRFDGTAWYLEAFGSL